MIRLGVGEMIPEQWRGAVRKGFEGAYLEAAPLKLEGWVSDEKLY